MKPPIIADYRGDVSIFETVEAAEGGIETYDVRDNECVIYDSEGRLLRGEIEGSHNWGRVVLKSAEDIPAHAGELKKALIGFLIHFGEIESELQECSLADLVRKRLQIEKKGKKR
ncbi:MAG TPA: hypothetical protein VF944_03620 [Candidatus Bathyarchaeia archaeon]